MKNLKKTIVCILTLTACSLAGAALSLAQNTASAETNATIPEAQTQLLLPSTYEQYLDLTTPTDVAICEDYTAIADGNVIYVYDKADGAYRKYVHEYNTEDPSKNNITKLQFDEEGNLYFLDVMFLHSLAPDTLDHPTPTVTNSSLPCNNFYLHKNMLYFINSPSNFTQLSQLDIEKHGIDAQKTETLIDSFNGNSALTVYEGELYYTDNATITRLNLATKSTAPVAWMHQSQLLTSIQIVDGVLCCTDNYQTFYAYELPETAGTTTANLLTQTEGTFSALTSFENMVYAVNGNSIRQFSVADLAFTDYEICNKSASQNRLNSAADTHLINGLLLLADNGNQRISILDTKSGEFLTPIQNTLTTSYLVSDGNTVLAANEDGAVLYSMQAENYGDILAKFDNFIGNIVGAASVYGKYYLALDNYFHYLITTKDNGEWTLTEIARRATRTPSLLTADAYGNLYVASGTAVHCYTEEEFLSTELDGAPYGNLPQPAQKITVDYEGSLYALIDGKLYKLDQDEAYPLNTPLVYTDTATITSFTFGIEDNQTFLLYEENYVAKTTVLQLPTLKTIEVGDTAKEIFAEESASFSVVQTEPDALITYFDIFALQDAEFFPYLSYERRTIPFVALKIGETENQSHNLLAVFNAETREYQTCLVLKKQCVELPDNEYRTDCNQEKGYLSSAVSLYKFPYLTSLLTVSRLDADAEIILLGKIDKLDHPYYHVAFVDENGNRYTGFVPTAYVTDFSGKTPVPEKVVYGDTKNNNDDIFRLCYLILGSGVICILADILLLKKRKKDEDEK